MAWRSSGRSNAQLVENLSSNGLVVSTEIRRAMLSVDRADYCAKLPYEDSPQSIGYGATISAPHMHADACEKLCTFLRPGAKVLDIGCGSGYLTHIFAEMVKPDGKVLGVDHIQSLVDIARTNMAKSEGGQKMLDQGIVEFIAADGRLGYGAEEPYDAIHVGAAAAEDHKILFDQLKAPGRLFVPIEENGLQHIYVVDKRVDGSMQRNKLYGVRYVPLTSPPVYGS